MINYKKNVWSTNTRLSAEALNNIRLCDLNDDNRKIYENAKSKFVAKEA